MEVRKDYVLDRWVYFASDRSKRPHDFIKTDSLDKKSAANCAFCPGREKLTPPEIGRIEEKLTPPEIGRIEENGKWAIRWFNNKFPAVEKKEAVPSVLSFMIILALSRN